MSNGQGHPADYTGLHSFVFIDHVAPWRTAADVVKRIRSLGKPPVMYASTFVGEFVAFAHLRTETLSELQDLVEGPITDAGALCSFSIESPIAELGAKRRSPGLIALTRIKVSPGSVDGVREQLVSNPEAPGLVGASVISGEWDILLQMTGSDIEDAKANIEGLLSGDERISRTSTSFADGDRTEERNGPIPEN